MACNYIMLDRARDELDEVSAYLLAATGDAKATEDFLGDIEAKILLICEFPTMFALSRMPELAERGYRAALAGSYVILYTFTEDTVFVEHIFHQRQDYANLV